MYVYFQVVVLFCGDFNSGLRIGLVEFFIIGRVDFIYRDWILCEDKEEYCIILFINYDWYFFFVCGFLVFINYIGGFKGILDYIFGDKRYLEVEFVIFLLSEDDFFLYFVLLFVVMSLDYLVLVCDVKWKL